MKKASIILILVMIVSLAACGSAPAAPAEAPAAPTAASAEPAPAQQTAQEPAEAAESAAAAPEEPVTEEKAVQIIPLDPESIFTVDGNYTISALYSDILTDSATAEGWYYGYTTGTESVGPAEVWSCANGMYTSCELMFDLENLNENMDRTFIDRFRGFIVFNMDISSMQESSSAYDMLKAIREEASADPSAELFEFTDLQRNPGQLDTDGVESRSTDAVLLAKGETAQQDIIADISEEFLRSWESGSEPMWAVFTYDDSTLFTVDLRAYMKDSME